MSDTVESVPGASRRSELGGELHGKLVTWGAEARTEGDLEGAGSSTRVG